MATTAVGAGSSSAQPVAQAVGHIQAQIAASGEELAERGAEAPVDLEGVHEAPLLGEARREQAVAGADLEHDVVGRHASHGEDRLERAPVDQMVLAVAPPGRRSRVSGAHERGGAAGASRAKARRALALVTAATSSSVQPRKRPRNCAVSAT